MALHNLTRQGCSRSRAARFRASQFRAVQYRAGVCGVAAAADCSRTRRSPSQQKVRLHSATTAASTTPLLSRRDHCHRIYHRRQLQPGRTTLTMLFSRTFCVWPGWLSYGLLRWVIVDSIGWMFTLYSSICCMYYTSSCSCYINVWLFGDLAVTFSKTTIGSVFVQLTYSIFSALCTLGVITSSGVTLLSTAPNVSAPPPAAALKRSARYWAVRNWAARKRAARDRDQTLVRTPRHDWYSISMLPMAVYMACSQQYANSA